MGKKNATSGLGDFLAETMAEAGRELDARQGTHLQIFEKSDQSLVTEADLASERVILARIRRYFPEDQILSEESGLTSTERRPGSHIWIVDPLDGTTNYANGFPFYCISIGRGRFRADGSIEIVAGSVYDAVRHRFYYASAGEGATVDGRPLRVASARDFAKCFLVTGFYYWAGDELEREIRRFAKVATRCQSIRRDGAAALDLALVAEGVYDGFWEAGLKPWDVAAGALLVQEAGGRIRNYEAGGLHGYDIEGAGTIAGAPQVVETLAGIL